MQLNGAASLVLIESGITYCFVQQSKIPNSSIIFEGSELKVQLDMGHEFHIKKSMFIANHICSWHRTYC